MLKILVEFDSIEQAQQAIYAVSGNQAAAPAPAFQPNVAPQQQYAPAPAAPQQYAPAPQQQYAPQPAPGPAPGAPMPQQHWQQPGQQPAPGMAPQGQPAPGMMPPGAPAPGPSAPTGITKDAMIAAAQKYSKARGGAATKAVLERFGVKAVGDLPEATWAQFLQAVAV